jgi:hypothetical protein
VPIISDEGGGGGEGVAPDSNWCQVDLDVNPTLNVAGPSYIFQVADLSIHSQSGTDFSIGSTAGFPVTLSGAIISAAGGWFQAACFAAAPGGIALDGGSAAPRWLEFFYAIGLGADSAFPAQGLGVDVFLPVVASNGDLADARVSAPGYAAPGNPLLFRIGLELLNGFGTDAITGPLDNFGKFVLWQVA